MANITLDTRQQQKHDTSTNFNNANKLYLEGEFLVETDTGKVKIGDGTLGYKSLPYTIGTRVPEGAKFTDTTYSAATSTALGLVKVGYTESGKNYPVELDADDKMFVNVPWTDTNTTYSQATSSTLGLIKIGYTESGKNYPVELNTSGQAFVNVPWTDTTYSVATTSANGLMSSADKTKLDGIANNANNYSLPLSTASVRGGIKIGYAENGKNYPVELSNEQAYVNVPWTDTTYSVFVKSGTGAKSGLVPTPPDTAGTTKFLREDAVWVAPPTANNPSITISQNGTIKGQFTLNQADSETIALTDTTYSEFTGATTTAAGTSGLVPAPTSGQSTRYLCSNGEWSVPQGSIYNGSTAISVKPSTADGEYNIYLVALFPGTTSQSVGPSASATINFGTSFNVPHITIDQYGRITALANRSMLLSGALASSSAPGLCPKLDSGHPSYYLNAGGTWSAPRGKVYGVKGNAETAYREGQVNITAANVGALPITGGTVSGATTFSDTVTLSTAGSITYDDGFYDG